MACGIFSDWGPVSPASAGTFLTTGPPLLKNLNALTLQATFCKVLDYSFTYFTTYNVTVIHMPLITHGNIFSNTIFCLYVTMMFVKIKHIICMYVTWVLYSFNMYTIFHFNCVKSKLKYIFIFNLSYIPNMWREAQGVRECED